MCKPLCFAPLPLFGDGTVCHRTKGKGLEFKPYIDPSIPCMLCGDEVRIVQQVLINLLNNAVKYTSEGSVTFSVHCQRQKGNRVLIWYSVEDTGQGVKKENIPYLFNAFRRVDEEKNRYIEGTGLGLSIVQQLVELMGGEVSVNSVYTKGSAFIVALEQEIVDEKELGTFTLDSMAKHVSAGYQNALEAAKSFNNVTVIDSGHLSSSMGLSVLYAAYLAEHHTAKAEIVASVRRMERFISSAFIQ